MKKILLIGDSIRRGYDKYVKMAFEGTAEVCYPETNCMFSSVIIRCLIDWAEELKCGKELDLIHWNSGLWDDLIMMDGKRLVSPGVYAENIERICDIIERLFPSAKMIFATTTPVQEELFKRHKRYNKHTELYNSLACDIVKQHGGYINDLYAMLLNKPVSYHSDLTHYYTREGTECITNQVVSSIEKVLSIHAKKLDYNKIFESPVEIIGQ